MKRKISAPGFTLIETVTAMTILVIAVSLALSGYMYMLKKANLTDRQHALDIDVQTAIERLKIDLRLSSMDEVFGYPQGTPPFEAISFPVAKVDPSTGRLQRDPATKEIIWDQTYVYHIVSGAPDELTRTIFDYNPALADSDRQAQLDYIVENDGVSGAPNISNVRSEIIFSNLLKWGLNPRGGLFSCYSETTGRETIALGYALLKADENVLTFKAVGKQGSGYKIGIDQILAGPSYRYREAEFRLANHVSSTGPNTPRSHSMSSYGNRHQLLFDADAPGNTLSIAFDNDRWDVADFGNLEGSGYSGKDQSEVTPDYNLDDIVVKLEGSNTAWTAEAQTEDYDGFLSTSNLTGATVTILHKGSGLDNGNHFLHNGQRSKLTFTASTNSPLTISSVQFGESSSSNDISFNFGGGQQQVTFKNSTSVYIPAGTSVVSDWIEVPVEKDKNYITTYLIDAASTLQMWGDYRASTGSPATPSTTQIATSSGAVYGAYVIPALESITVSYVERGTYTSDIMDTRLNDALYNYISWNSLLPGNSTLSFKVRFGNEPDLSDAAEFDAITSSIPVSSSKSDGKLSGSGRYVQFQAIMESSKPDYLQTPILKEVSIDWEGEKRMVNIMGKFTKGPDYGDFELSLNGEPLQAALIVDLEIYENVTFGMNKKTQRLSSSIKAEITPRNSGL